MAGKGGALSEAFGIPNQKKERKDKHVQGSLTNRSTGGTPDRVIDAPWRHNIQMANRSAAFLSAIPGSSHCQFHGARSLHESSREAAAPCPRPYEVTDGG